MKKLYSFIAFSLLFCTLMGQINVELNRLNVITDTQGNTMETDSVIVSQIIDGASYNIASTAYKQSWFWFTIKNLDSSNKTYKIKKSHMNLPDAESYAYVCSPSTNNSQGQCSFGDETNSFVLEPNEVAYAEVQYYNGTNTAAGLDVIIFLGESFEESSANERLKFSINYSTNLSSIASQNFNNYSIYPNPAKSIFTLSGDFSSKTIIEVYNIIGKLVYKTNVEKGANSMTIDCNKWEKGYYFVRILNNQKLNKTLKLVVR